MSILLAVKKNNTVYMATDTREIVSGNKRSNLCEASFKIQKKDNGMLVGITGDRFTRQTLFANLEIFTLNKKGKLTKKHIVTEIVPKIIDLLDAHGMVMQTEDGFISMKAKIVLAHQGSMFEICAGFLVIKYEDLQVLGEASSGAEVVLFNSKPDDDVEERLIRALDVASKYCLTVGAPYLLINTKNLEYSVVKGDK